MSTSKVTTKAATESKAETAFKLSAKVKAAVEAAITTCASAEKSALAAIRVSEQSTVKLAKALNDASIPDKDTAKALFRDTFTAAYTAAGRPELYALQQWSRVLTLAFPADKKAAEQLAKGIANNTPVNGLYALARGGAKLDSKNKVVPVVKAKADKRGGHNKTAPLDAAKKAIENAVTAASQDDEIEFVQLLNFFLDACKACKYYDDADEVRDLIED